MSQERENKVLGRGDDDGVGVAGVLAGWSTDPSDMEAWELDIRIRMAEKQKRYTEITKKLKRLQSLKSKKAGGESPRKGESMRKAESPKKKWDHKHKHKLEKLVESAPVEEPPIPTVNVRAESTVLPAAVHVLHSAPV